MLYDFVSDNHARCNTLPEKTMLKFTFAEILTINGKKGEGNTAQQLWISADSLSCALPFAELCPTLGRREFVFELITQKLATCS